MKLKPHFKGSPNIVRLGEFNWIEPLISGSYGIYFIDMRVSKGFKFMGFFPFSTLQSSSVSDAESNAAALRENMLMSSLVEEALELERPGADGAETEWGEMSSAKPDIT